MVKNDQWTPSVLVVDDDKLIRAIIVDTLKSTGCLIQEATNGKEAFEMALENSFDLILCDVIMPGMDGLDFLERFRNKGKDAEIIMVTSSPNLETAIETMRLGAGDFIRKPFTQEDLRTSIQKALERVRLKALTRDYHTVLEEKVFQQEDRIRFLFYEAIQSLIYAIEAKDPYTQGHSQRVTTYAMWLVKELDLPFETASEIHVAAQLHDIGKLGVPDNILNKPAKLTGEEFTIIKEHPEEGCKILAPIVPKNPLNIILHHHEKWEGGGYPQGFSRADIPLGSRILALADSFDAMTSRRAYRQSWNIKDTFAEIHQCTGSQFDPELAESFITAIKRNIHGPRVSGFEHLEH
ncbi:response regulator [bacterium]|nr:MAG: response regulator [bacterium]